ncbi:MAG: hypothetical protein CMM52_15855 [Rhodospirillaceae bacterium]|nr:hypothetical protein [Rhodospirillaceae bacterium]|tara:strand:+ start:8924 stop:9709 length:786 start_codon:yes stop_codon:yes gene_type:complete
MDFGLEKKSVIVSAASSGLGFSIAKSFAMEGATVTLSGRNEEKVSDAVQRISEEASGIVEGCVCDVTSAEQSVAMVKSVSEKHGLDVMIANTPGADTAPFVEMTDDMWRKAAETKIFAQIRLAREAFSQMQSSGGGRIMFMAGTHGKQPHAHAITAGFSNAALQNISKALSEEGAPHGILCNVINPGPFATHRMVYLAEEKAREDNISLEEATAILTEETVLKRYGDPEELAALVVFLASNKATYITGASFDIDGGQVKTI